MIEVCPGTYVEQLVIARDVTLRGTGGASGTILDADGDVALTAVASAVAIEGFTITGGGAVHGALDATTADVTLTDCRVTGNDGATGGVLGVDRGSLTLMDVGIDQNSGTEATVLQSTDADVRFERVTVTDNEVVGTPEMGAWQVIHLGGKLEVFNTVVRANRPQDPGGLVFTELGGDVFVVNSVFDLPVNGGAINTRVPDESDITVQNSVFLGDGVQTGLGLGVNGVVEYSLFWKILHPWCYGSCVDAVSGTGNLDVDPRFVDSAGGDFTLDAFSPCVDAGNPATAYEDRDGSRNDLGVTGGPFGG